MNANYAEGLHFSAFIITVGRFLNAWLNVCVSGKKWKLRVEFLRLLVALRGLQVTHLFIAFF